jgi:hypothetical protein
VCAAEENLTMIRKLVIVTTTVALVIDGLMFNSLVDLRGTSIHTGFVWRLPALALAAAALWPAVLLRWWARREDKSADRRRVAEAEEGS